MGTKINDAMMAIIKQDFMAGESLRDLATKHGVGVRTLAKRSKAEGWAAQREMQQTATAVPILVTACERRVEVVRRTWEDRLGSVIESVSRIAEDVADLLAQQDLSGADWRELATLLRLLTSSIESLQRMVPSNSGRRSGPTMSAEDAAALFNRLLGLVGCENKSINHT